MLVHHTRNTAAKQWDETKVLSLQGIAKVFTSFQLMLTTLMDYSKAWKILLETIEASVGDPSDEVSKAGILALQECFRTSPPVPEGVATEFAKTVPELSTVKATAAWRQGWDTFLRVADKVALRRPLPTSQSYLVGVVECFPLLYARPGQDLSIAEYERALVVIRNVAELQHHEALTVSSMTQTQEAALKGVLAPVSGDAASINEAFVPSVLIELARYASLGCNPPPPPSSDGKTDRRSRIGACQAMALAAMDELSTQYVCSSSFHTLPQRAHRIPFTRRRARAVGCIVASR